MSFVLYPAIDVRAGRIVRLRQGDYARETGYAGSPLAAARRYAEQGAAWLHLVDLDGARDGGHGLAPLLREIVAGTGLQVQAGGGVRDSDGVQRLLDAGAARVVIGSMAVQETARVEGWIARFGPEAIVVALDARLVAGQWQLPVAGWTAPTGASLAALAAGYEAAGAVHLLSTDIGRDGMLSGPGLGLYRRLRAAAPQLQVQASGGIRDAQDVARLQALGCAGAILGRTLLEGRMALADATC